MFSDGCEFGLFVKLECLRGLPYIFEEVYHKSLGRCMVYRLGDLL